jgi:hypothetical protein
MHGRPIYIWKDGKVVARKPVSTRRLPPIGLRLMPDCFSMFSGILETWKLLHQITNTEDFSPSPSFLVSASPCPLDRFLPLTLHALRLTPKNPLSDPGHTDTGFMDKTKPHGLFLKDNFFSKLSTIRQQSPPESVYAHCLKGMRIHRDGSLAQAEGWEQSQIPKKLLVRNRPYR